MSAAGSARPTSLGCRSNGSRPTRPRIRSACPRRCKPPSSAPWPRARPSIFRTWSPQAVLPRQRRLVIQRAGQSRAGLGEEIRAACGFLGGCPCDLFLGQENALLRLLLDEFGLAEQIHKDAYLGAQDLR